MSDEEENKGNPFDLFPLGPLLPSSWSQLAQILGFVVLAIILTTAAISALIGVMYLSNEVFQIATQSVEEVTDKNDNFAKLRNSLFILAALIGVPFFLWRTWIARRQSLSAENQAETARDRAYTELFTKAIEQLGAEKPAKKVIMGEDQDPKTVDDFVPNIEVRIGAIYALERIMKDSEKDAPAIVDTLAAYVRENCGEPQLECKISEQAEGEIIWEWVTSIKDDIGNPWNPEEGSLVYRARNLQNVSRNRVDIKTALTVIGRRPLWLKDPKDFKTHETQMPDLRNVNFQGWDLSNFDLSYCNLFGAEMQGADMAYAEMQGANMSDAKMQGANVSDAKMQGANVSDAKMQGADMARAKMQGATMRSAQMQGANMARAEMQGANMSDAKMQGARMAYAKMQGASMAYAKIQGASMRSAQMKEANMSGAQMNWTHMSGAQMKGANMKAAEIDETQITSAQTTAASIFGIDFTNAKFKFDKLRTQLPKMFGHKAHTRLPEGMAIPEHWSEADMSTSEGHKQYNREWEAFKKQMGVE